MTWMNLAKLYLQKNSVSREKRPEYVAKWPKCDICI